MSIVTTCSRNIGFHLIEVGEKYLEIQMKVMIKLFKFPSDSASMQLQEGDKEPVIFE